MNDEIPGNPRPIRCIAIPVGRPLSPDQTRSWLSEENVRLERQITMRNETITNLKRSVTLSTERGDRYYRRAAELALQRTWAVLVAAALISLDLLVLAGALVWWWLHV